MKNFFMKSLVLSMLLIVMASSALGSVVNLYPNGDGFYGQWTSSGCPTAHYQCVDEISANGFTDYVYTNGAFKTETYDLQDLPGGVNSISSIDVRYTARQYTSSNYKFTPWLRSGGNDYTNLAQMFSTTGSWVPYNRTYNVNPITGNSWTVSEVNGLEAGMETSGDSPGAYVTQVLVAVTYS